LTALKICRNWRSTCIDASSLFNEGLEGVAFRVDRVMSG
jgi:hypothetical protein